MIFGGKVEETSEDLSPRAIVNNDPTRTHPGLGLEHCVTLLPLRDGLCVDI